MTKKKKSMEQIRKDVELIFKDKNDEKVCMPYAELGKKEGYRCQNCFNWNWLYQEDTLVNSNIDPFEENTDVVFEIASVEYGNCDSFNIITHAGFLCFGYVVNRDDIDFLVFDDRKFTDKEKVTVLGEVIKKSK